MSGYTLTWRGGRIVPGDAALLRPDVLGGLPQGELARTRLQVGRDSVELGELFTLAGAPGATLTLRGLPALDRLGAQLAAGELIVEGDAGDDLGAAMTGGRIRVTGQAGARVGGPGYGQGKGMRGGEILISGNCGDYAGLRMRRGLIAVAGSTQASPGYQMLAGTIVLGRGPLDYPGLEMRRGSILCLDPAVGDHAGAVWPHLREEGIFDSGAIVAVALVLKRMSALGWAPAGRGGRDLPGRFRFLSGDRLETGRGEVWLESN